MMNDQTDDEAPNFVSVNRCPSDIYNWAYIPWIWSIIGVGVMKYDSHRC